MSHLSEDPNFYNNLSPCEKMCYDLYKGNSSFQGEECFADYLNSILRQGGSLIHEWELAAECLDIIIKKNKCPEELTLWRATFEDFIEPYLNSGVMRSVAHISGITCGPGWPSGRG